MFFLKKQSSSSRGRFHSSVIGETISSGAWVSLEPARDIDELLRQVVWSWWSGCGASMRTALELPRWAGAWCRLPSTNASTGGTGGSSGQNGPMSGCVICKIGKHTCNSELVALGRTFFPMLMSRATSLNFPATARILFPVKYVLLCM